VQSLLVFQKLYSGRYFHILKGEEIKERRLTQGRKHQKTLYLPLFAA